MKLRFEAPSAMETAAINVENGSVDITPLLIRGQHLVRVGYVTAIGDNGTTSKATIVFNGNNGEFSIQRVDKAPVVLAFDQSPAAFNTRLELARANAKKRRMPPADQPPQQPPLVTTAVSGQTKGPASGQTH